MNRGDLKDIGRQCGMAGQWMRIISYWHILCMNVLKEGEANAARTDHK